MLSEAQLLRNSHAGEARARKHTHEEMVSWAKLGGRPKVKRINPGKPVNILKKEDVVRTPNNLEQLRSLIAQIRQEILSPANKS